MVSARSSLSRVILTVGVSMAVAPALVMNVRFLPAPSRSTYDFITTVSVYWPGATHTRYRLEEFEYGMLLSAAWMEVKSPPDLATVMTFWYGLVFSAYNA